MVDLDCESPQSSLNSLSRIFGIDEMGLREFLASIDLDRHYELNNPQLMAGPELLRLFELEGGRQRESIDRVYWFHLTRVLSSTQFQDGILPLGQVLPSIWTMLFKLFTGTHHEARLRAMQAAGVADRHFNFKTNNSDQWGPFAMLVRDVAFFSAEVHNHDYLRTPEIVEDICNGYREQFGENIQAAIEHSMVPTIVKFWSTYQGYGLESAMCYAYCCVHKEQLRSSANTCFDGEGTTVPFEHIVSIQALHSMPKTSASVAGEAG